jgi:pyruvate ferredoxin oxidoreductase gamma subunit
MDEIIEVRWHGRGGQGVVTASELLAECALQEGKYFQGFPEYGPERMGAPVRAFTRISESPIHIHSPVETPDIVVLLDPTLAGKVDIAEGLPDSGILICNWSKGVKDLRRLLGTERGQLYVVDATRIAIDSIGRAITNTPMLGAVVKATSIVKFETLLEKTRERFEGRLSEKLVEGNIAAVKRAYEEVEKR